MSQSVQAVTGAISLTVIDGTPTTTSLQVAQHFGKRHDNVMRDIQTLRDQLPSEHLLNFEEASIEVDQPNGGKATYPAYRLTRDGFTLLAMGFTGKKALTFKLAYIDAFNQMERELVSQQAKAPYTTRPGDKLSAEQQHALRYLLESSVKKLPKAVQGQAMTQGWSKLKSHFGVAYRDIPAHEFSEAVSIVARHAVQWSIVDDAAQHLNKPPVPPAWLSVSIDWEFITAAVNRGEVPDDMLMPLTKAASASLFRATCGKPAGIGKDITKQINAKTPLADLYEVATQATLELNMRVQAMGH